MFPAADLSLKMVFQNTTKHENICFVHHPGKNRQIDYFFIMLPAVFVFKIFLLPSAKKNSYRFCKLFVVFLLENCNIKNAAIHMVSRAELSCNRSVASGDAIETEFFPETGRAVDKIQSTSTEIF